MNVVFEILIVVTSDCSFHAICSKYCSEPLKTVESVIQIKFLVHVFIVMFLVNSSKDLYFNDDIQSGR
jgi:hypothetical protein